MGVEFDLAKKEITKLPDFYERVRMANPLDADELLGRVPELNSQAGAETLVKELSIAVGKFRSEPRILTLDAAMGLTRDLSLPASMMVRYGHGLEEVPGLEETMMDASKVTKEGPVWTLWHYANGNPQEKERRRTFTDSWQEDLFIDCLADANLGWLNATSNLSIARDLAITDPEFTLAVGRANLGLEEARVAMAKYSKVDTDFFNAMIAPNFPPLVVFGRTYRNASGADAGILAVEEILKGQKNREYYERHVDALPEPLGNLANEERMPMVDKVLLEIRDLKDVSAAYPALNAIRNSFKLIQLFNQYHFARAKRAMADRREDVGSGGESLATLEELGKQREGNYEEISQILADLKEAGSN